jgi:hypothetical protein
MYFMQLIDKKIRDLTEDAPDLPDFSAFHPAFKEAGPNQTPDGDMRTAFFLYAPQSRRDSDRCTACVKIRICRTFLHHST